VLPTPHGLRHFADQLCLAEQELGEVRARLLLTLGAGGWSGPAHEGFLTAGEAVAARLRHLAGRFGSVAEQTRWLARQCPEGPPGLACELTGVGTGGLLATR
jgi:hypothetical protein